MDFKDNALLNKFKEYLIILMVKQRWSVSCDKK